MSQAQLHALSSAALAAHSSEQQPSVIKAKQCHDTAPAVMLWTKTQQAYLIETGPVHEHHIRRFYSVQGLHLHTDHRALGCCSRAL